MKKTLCLIGIMVLVACGVPALAQGPFADVPTDHWAYDAVNELQMKGIVIGYPDGTFGGKRAMTRYEFAMAISRMIPLIESGLSDKITAMEGRIKALEGQKAPAPAPPPAPAAVPKPEVTAADLAKVQKLVDEFKDELASLGVDVDALRKDVAALNERVSVIEEKLAKIKVGFDVLMVGVASKNSTEGVTAWDYDNRPLSSNKDLLERVTFIREGDLSLCFKPNDTTTASVMLAIGNYLPYLQTADNYAAVLRPTNKSNGDADDIFPYWLNLSTMLGSIKLDVGRIPMQWTQYTLKKVDVDELLANPITDSGDYPVDGGKICFNLGKIGVEAYAAKNNSNRYLCGLVALPSGGMYGALDSFHAAGGGEMGGLGQIEQSAGARVTLPVSSAKLGLSYIQAGQEGGLWTAPSGTTDTYDKAELMGADLNFNIGKVALSAEYAQTETKGIGGTADIDDDNAAWDGKLGFNLGSLGIDAGYRRIESNFAAPGAWGRVGPWANPVNIKGPYVGLKYDASSALSIGAVGEFYKAVDDLTVGGYPISTEDKMDRAKVNLRYAFTSKTSLGAGYEWISFKPDGPEKSTDKYITLDLTHKINPDAMVKIGYQIVDYKAGEDGGPYGDEDFKGDVGYVQFGVKF